MKSLDTKLNQILSLLKTNNSTEANKETPTEHQEQQQQLSGQ